MQQQLLFAIFLCALACSAKTKLDYLLSDYRNEPVTTLNAMSISLKLPSDISTRQNSVLIHDASDDVLRATGDADGPLNTLVGLATMRHFYNGFIRLVALARSRGYDHNIILGVSDDIRGDAKAFNLLRRMNVTMYAVTLANCTGRAGSSEYSAVRGKCSQGLEQYPLEWGRYIMAMQWMQGCVACRDGWFMLMDTRDIFFQADPFAQLGDARTAPVNLLLVEEVSPVTSLVMDQRRYFTCSNPRARAHTVPCYGNSGFSLYGERPVLNSGSIVGTFDGVMRLLRVLVQEFSHHASSGNRKCHSPSTTDQWILNYLYYTGRFLDPDRTATLPWGVGPVLTVGKACMSADRKSGAKDMMRLRSDGSVLNPHDGRVAAAVHQFDRCGQWMAAYMRTLVKKIPPHYL